MAELPVAEQHSKGGLVLGLPQLAFECLLDNLSSFDKAHMLNTSKSLRGMVLRQAPVLTHKLRTNVPNELCRVLPKRRGPLKLQLRWLKADKHMVEQALRELASTPRPVNAASKPECCVYELQIQVRWRSASM